MNQRMSWCGLCVRLTVVAVVVGASTLMLGARTADAQGQGKYVTEATERLHKLINQANKDGYGLADDRFSIGGGWIKQGASNWVALYTINLTGGKNYRFLASGDFDAKDVDLEIQNAGGKVLASDTSTDPNAIVDFTPKASGKYLVRVRLYASKNSVPCVVLAIAMAQK